MDAQRLDRLSVYGYPRPTSPHLERLAERGLVYDQAYSTSSWTWPATASILTGMLPEEHGVLSENSCFLHPSLVTLAEVLQRQGFTTAGYSGNPLIVPDKNFDQGFELFYYGKARMRKSKYIIPRVLDWLRGVAGTRFFLYLHLVEPHCPLVALPQGRELFAAHVPRDFSTVAIHEYHLKLLKGEGHTSEGEIATEECVPAEHQQWISDLYDACVWSGDHWVGMILDELSRLGLEDETLVLYTSDHGEELFDHGFATHGHSLHGELVRVPLILAGPGIPCGMRVNTPVSNRQVAPTLAYFGGARLTTLQDPLDLTSIEDVRAAAREPILFSTRTGWWNGRSPQNILGMRLDDMVLHYAPDSSPWPGKKPKSHFQFRLFDVSRDSEEKHDVAAQHALQAEKFLKALERRVKELEKRRRSPVIQAGDATLEMLRGIGYIGDDD